MAYLCDGRVSSYSWPAMPLILRRTWCIFNKGSKGAGRLFRYIWLISIWSACATLEMRIHTQCWCWNCLIWTGVAFGIGSEVTAKGGGCQERVKKCDVANRRSGAFSWRRKSRSHCTPTVTPYEEGHVWQWLKHVYAIGEVASDGCSITCWNFLFIYCII